MELLRTLAKYPEVVILAFSALFTLASAFFTGVTAIATWKMAATANRTVALAKQQGVFQLRPYWSGVRYVDPNSANVNVDHVLTNADALQETASAWNTGTVDRSILYQDYGHAFMKIYEQLDAVQYPQKRRDGSKIHKDEVLPGGVTDAYNGMKKMKAQKR